MILPSLYYIDTSICMCICTNIYIYIYIYIIEVSFLKDDGTQNYTTSDDDQKYG